ncbi:MAG: hypothetical protein WC139_00585 [Candidatus Kapaibacterium sp.]
MTAEARKIKSDFLLESLSPKEIEQFDKYIRSKNGKGGVRILKFWQSKFNTLRNESLNRHSDASGDFSRKTISDFVKILESFIATKGYEMDLLSQKIYLAKELRSRNVDKYFTSLIDDVCSDNSVKYLKGYSYMSNLQRLYVEEYFLCNSRSEEEGMYDISAKILKNAEVVLIKSKLFEFINRKLYTPDANPLKDEILSVGDAVRIVEKNASCYSVNYPNVYLDYLFYKMLKKPDERERVSNALKYLREKEKELALDFIQFSYETLIRFLSVRINSGCSVSQSTLYELFKEVEGTGILNKIQNVQPMIFILAVATSLSINDITFANKLIALYKGKINISYRDEVIAVSRALTDFAAGKYENVKMITEDFKTRNASLYLFSKSTLLKALFELKEDRNIMPLIDTTKHFLNRKLADRIVQKESIFKFLNYLNSLCSVRRKNRRGAEILLDKIKDEKTFYQKKWVLSKAEELAKQQGQ